MNRSLTITFAATAILSGLVTYGSDSYARIIPGIACQVQLNGVPGQDGLYDASGTGNYHCPFVEDGASLKSSVTGIYIDFFDNSTQFRTSAQVCSKPWNGAAMHCGAEVADGSLSLIGNRSLEIDGASISPAWGQDFANDYGVISVWMGPGILYGITTF